MGSRIRRRGTAPARRPPRAVTAATSLVVAVSLAAGPGATPRHAVPAPLAARADTGEVSFEVAPGVRFTAWTETGAHGPVRLHLLTVDYRQRGLRLDYADPGAVASTATVLSMTRAADGVAGVNGDFYDIGRTGAPLGTGRSRTEGVLHARSSGWNSAFWLTRRGRPDIGTVSWSAQVRGHPEVAITSLNSPRVAADGIGMFTPAWGPEEPDTQVTGDQETPLRRVAVRDGVVAANGKRLRPGRDLEGTVLIARGTAAATLRDALPIGTRVRIDASLSPAAATVITGDRFLIEDGVVRVVDDTRLAPRTAIGIDRETRQLLILVADGRRERSRGLTMVELANEMIDLGADEALNLDGGGSSTMVVRAPDGDRELAVRNRPSDGFARHVANGLVLTYDPPGA